MNELEQREDIDGRWRAYVNDQLAGPYTPLFALVDYLVLLQAPGFDTVFEWRAEQERDLLARSSGTDASRIMDDVALRRFIMHFERLTRHILQEMPGRADLVVRLDRHREVLGTAKPTEEGARLQRPVSTGSTVR